MAAAGGVPHALVSPPRDVAAPPPLAPAIADAVARAADVVLLLDYDGTLTPIVADPAAAALGDDVRRALEGALAAFPCTVVITGRSAATAARFLGPTLAPRLQLAASHGFDVRGPLANATVGAQYLPDLAAARDALAAALAGVPGASVEDNAFSVTVHYRNVAPADRPAVHAAVEAYLAGGTGGNSGGGAGSGGRLDAAANGDPAPAPPGQRLVARPGNCVHELRPALPWNKGEAAKLVVRQLGMDAPSTLVIALGDDLTDEDMFGVLVPPRPAATDGAAGPTAADAITAAGGGGASAGAAVDKTPPAAAATQQPRQQQSPLPSAAAGGCSCDPLLQPLQSPPLVARGLPVIVHEGPLVLAAPAGGSDAQPTERVAVSRPTAALYALRDVGEVAAFLRALAEVPRPAAGRGGSRRRDVATAAADGAAAPAAASRPC